MNDVLKKLGQLGLVPVVKIDRAEDALPLADALIAGGLPAAEITFRTAAAKDAIAAIAAARPEMLVGAGTVLTTAQVDEAVAAGARFIVSPGLNPKVVSYCVQRGIPVTPGVSTLTVAGSRRVNTAASSMSEFCLIAHSTPRPRLPYPIIPILTIFILRLRACARLCIGQRT